MRLLALFECVGAVGQDNAPWIVACQFVCVFVFSAAGLTYEERAAQRKADRERRRREREALAK